MPRSQIASSLLCDCGHITSLFLVLRSCPGDKGDWISCLEGSSCSDSVDGGLFFLPCCRPCSIAHCVGQNRTCLTLRVEQPSTLESRGAGGCGAEAPVLHLGSVRLPESEFWLSYLKVLWPWEIHLTPLSLMVHLKNGTDHSSHIRMAEVNEILCAVAGAWPLLNDPSWLKLL